MREAGENTHQLAGQARLFRLVLTIVALLLPLYGAQRYRRVHPGFRRHPPRQMDFLRRLSKLPPARQERMIRNSRQFQRLPPARQQQILARLRWFDSLPPARQQQVLRRMRQLQRLTPAQRQGLRQLQQGLKALPPPRRRMLRRAFIQVRDLPPPQQQRRIQRMIDHGRLDPQDAGLLQRALSLNLPSQIGPHRQRQ